MFHVFLGLVAICVGCIHLRWPVIANNPELIAFLGAVGLIVVGALEALGVFGGG